MSRRAMAIFVLLLTTTAGCASTEKATEPRKQSPVGFIVIDADEHGAIVADTRRAEFLGVDRDGTIVWRSPQATAAPDASMCAGRCPDALLSGNSASRNADNISDPQPELVVGGHREPVGGAALAGRVKRTVLTATDAGNYLVTAGMPGRWTLDAVRQGAAVVRTPVTGARATWAQSADRRHGLAVVSDADPTRSAAVWFTYTADGWRPDGAAVPVVGSSACLDRNGNRAILLGDRPAVRFRDGHKSPVSDLDYASDCAFAATGGIVAKYGQDKEGITAQIQVFGQDGSVTLRIDMRATARVTADPVGARVAYVTAGKATEINPVTGDIVRTIHDAFGARYDGAGNLVVVNGNGTPRWLPTAR